MLRRHPLAVAYIVMALTVGFVLGWTAHQNARDVQRVRNDTIASRIASCQQYNVQQHTQIVAEKLEIRALINALASGSRSPRTAEKIKAFYEVYDPTVDRAHPLRDCSTAGIDKYLNVKS